MNIFNSVQFFLPQTRNISDINTTGNSNEWLAIDETVYQNNNKWFMINMILTAICSMAGQGVVGFIYSYLIFMFFFLRKKTNKQTNKQTASMLGDAHKNS